MRDFQSRGRIAIGWQSQPCTAPENPDAMGAFGLTAMEASDVLSDLLGDYTDGIMAMMEKTWGSNPSRGEATPPPNPSRPTEHNGDMNESNGTRTRRARTRRTNSCTATSRHGAQECPRR